jgi:hypothetical protein
MIFANTTKPKGVAAPMKLRHILADQVKPKVFDFDRNRYKEMNPKRKPGGPITTSQLGDIAAMKKRAVVAAERDAIRAKRSKMDIVADGAGAAIRARDDETYRVMENAIPAATLNAQVAEVVKKKGGRPKKAK